MTRDDNHVLYIKTLPLFKDAQIQYNNKPIICAVISQFSTLIGWHWSTPSSHHSSPPGRSSGSLRRWWSRRGCRRRRASWLMRENGALVPCCICRITWGGVCLLQLQLTIGHKLHSCDDRASQVNRAQRVVTLVASGRERCYKWKTWLVFLLVLTG